MKVLHVLSHPNIEQSRVNKKWGEMIKANKLISKSKWLYNEYPDLNINVAKEQKDLLDHDRIVLQFPFQWYHTPPLLKKWIDEVFLYGFAYGSGGDKLAGKELQLVISTGGPKDAYRKGGFNNFTIEELLRPLEQTANFTQMKYLPPLYLNDALNLTDEQIENYGKHILKVITS